MDDLPSKPSPRLLSLTGHPPTSHRLSSIARPPRYPLPGPLKPNQLSSPARSSLTGMIRPPQRPSRLRPSVAFLIRRFQSPTSLDKPTHQSSPNAHGDSIALLTSTIKPQRHQPPPLAPAPLPLTRRPPAGIARVSVSPHLLPRTAIPDHDNHSNAYAAPSPPASHRQPHTARPAGPPTPTLSMLTLSPQCLATSPSPPPTR